jgi:hypothetical protein
MKTPSESQLQRFKFSDTTVRRARPQAAARPTSSATADQKIELAAQIQRSQKSLNDLEALIHQRELEERSEDRKSKARKERAAKEHVNPKVVATKAQTARSDQQLLQGLKHTANPASTMSGGGSPGTTTTNAASSVSDLRVLATKMRGQIAVAKQKLAAL